MAMPRNLVLVRHGESEGNLATSRSKKGDDSDFSEEFRNRHSGMFRLSDRGREQAKIAGQWIKDNLIDDDNGFGFDFHRHYTSEYVRAMETSGLLDLQGARWFVEFYLRERDWGDLDVIPVSERNEVYSGAMKKKDSDAFYWTPPNGESMAELCMRVDRVLNTLHRECADKNVIIVCHGEVMWAFRVRLERMSQTCFRELDSSDEPKDRIHNCQILHYTRASDPTQFDEGNTLPYMSWVRSVCPWDKSLSKNKWQRIIRAKYSNKELLRRVAMTKQLVS